MMSPEKIVPTATNTSSVVVAAKTDPAETPRAETAASPTDHNVARNLLKEPVFLKCPACGTEGLTRIEEELKWWADAVNRCTFCCFYLLCCCVCFNYVFPCMQSVVNHYCQNCGCQLGRLE